MSIIGNVHWLKNSVQLLESLQCFFDLLNLVAFKPFILKKCNLIARTLATKVLQRTSEDFFPDVFLGRLSLKMESTVLKSTR